ncbi:Lysosomal acid phosphatase [Araneus ventricosus]|uniref:Lysosomal acid phosphatase n=1 Tax=Araneus ventricosus TaxID=182803 RepID=A0A4Y2MXQ7_ARAVE|nr:Lysosomal acid phosphatase [Araneus ventricosus]
MFSLLSLLSAFLILSRSFAEESTRLLLVQTLFRHGDRSPMFIYPKDQNKLDSWPEGLGKLTQLGKKQHYAVGKFLRSMYKDFVTSNPNEVSANSSATERSLSSAQAHLAAFYAPEGRWKFEDELNWQPIPIYTLPIKDDKVNGIFLKQFLKVLSSSYIYYYVQKVPGLFLIFYKYK